MEAATELLRRRRARASLTEYARYIDVPGAPIAEQDEEADYNTEALKPGNSREGHIFESLMTVQRWLETFGYPHVEPHITPVPADQEV